MHYIGYDGFKMFQIYTSNINIHELHGLSMLSFKTYQTFDVFHHVSSHVSTCSGLGVQRKRPEVLGGDVQVPGRAGSDESRNPVCRLSGQALQVNQIHQNK